MREKLAQKIVVAVSGASGSVYAKRLLTNLSAIPEQIAELSVVFSQNAKDIWQTETGESSFDSLPGKRFERNDFSAPFASGSAKYDTMIVIPCSMGTLGRIAAGVSDDLIARSADVMLKERRKLILVVRDTPYNLIHIRNMETVTLAGGIICPATPSFYSLPKTIDDVADTVVNRVLDLAGFEINSYRWGTSGAVEKDAKAE